MSSRQEVNRSYELTFETIKQMMHMHRKTGLLHAEISLRMMDVREPCRIEVKVVAGTIISCSLVGKSGRRIPERETMQVLARLGRVRWIFTPKQEVVVLSEPVVPSPTGFSSMRPRRLVFVDQDQSRSWPRLQRHVFALSDGTKSIAKIAEILSTTPELVENAVRDLQVKGVIATES